MVRSRSPRPPGLAPGGCVEERSGGLQLSGSFLLWPPPQTKWTWGPKGRGAVLLVNCDRDGPSSGDVDSVYPMVQSQAGIGGLQQGHGEQRMLWEWLGLVGPGIIQGSLNLLVILKGLLKGLGETLQWVGEQRDTQDLESGEDLLFRGPIFLSSLSETCKTCPSCSSPPRAPPESSTTTNSSCTSPCLMQPK